MRIIKDIIIKIDKNEVFRYQGYQKQRITNSKNIIMQMTEEEITCAYELFKPQGIYDSLKIKKILFSDERIDLENGFSLYFKDSVTALLKGAEHLVFGVVTIGHDLDNKVSEYFRQGENTRAFILDAIGTVAARYLSKNVRALACQEARGKNLQTTKHFTPGTAEWDISQQKGIFDLLPAYKIGVKLNASFMMNPKKSLSWAIGIGKHMVNPTKDDNSCQICQAVNCQYRKID